MNLSRKWLNEFVRVDVNDKDFAESMTVSGSKVEVTTDLGAEIRNVVVGKVVAMEHHPDSDHMWVCQVDVGRDAPIQIVTGAWNVHVGDYVPAALHKSTLPGGKKIEKGKLRGVVSDGMLCGLGELSLDTRDFPYAAICPAALLNDYKPLDPAKPSIPAAIRPGDKVYGPVLCGRITAVETNGLRFDVCVYDGENTHRVNTGCANLHEGDLVAYHTGNNSICTLADLHAEQAEFPHCIDDGIFILHEEDMKPGEDLKPLINADDHVVEFEITPNRPDCLSIIGLAREAAATFDQPLQLHEPVVRGGADGELTELLDVVTEAPELCPRYTARMVRNVKIAPSPKWMRERLRSMGVRPINNIVDITNYVMLEYGQPMHAFDYRYVKGGKIIVRRAKEGEELTTLDGNVRKLNKDHLVIADETRAVGLAGIMGGENSEIAADTVDVVFESANFNGTCIRKGALALGMRTEASAKFEKGLDILNTLPAVNRACELTELLGAGEVLDGVIDILNYVPQPTVLPIEYDRINALLGTEIAPTFMREVFQKLGFEVKGDSVTVPSWRADVKAMADLAEEVARFYGYNRIPNTLQRGETTRGGYSPAQQAENQIGLLCRTCGYDEIITYSFISPTYYDKIGWAKDDPRRESFRILNPLGEDTSIMRTTALPSMLEILSRNWSFHNAEVRLYELGKVYQPGGADGLAREPKFLTLGAYGEIDFFAFKGVVETVLRGLRIGELRFVAEKENPSYHPGRTAKVFSGDRYLGVFGEIHPLIAKNYGIEPEVYCAELSFDAMLASRMEEPVYRPLPRFPAVTRDLAVICRKEVTVAELEAAIRRGGKQFLAAVELFDIYTGAGIAEGMKSVAFALTLRAEDRNLTGEEADADMQSILQELSSSCGAVLR